MSTKYPSLSWATSSSAIKTEPSLAKRQGGWADLEKPPARFVNWIYYTIGQQLDNLNSAALLYDDLDDFVENASEGDRGIVEGFDASWQPLEELAALDVDDLISVDGDGEYLITCTNLAGIEAVERRSRLGVFDATYSLSASPTTLTRAVVNGAQVAVIYDSALEILNRDTGALIGSAVAHGAGLTDVAIDSARAYIVGGTGTGSVEVRAINLSDASSAWTYAHGAVVNSVCTDGVRVYIGGNAGTGGHHLRALDAATGSLLWSLTLSSAVAGGQALACDGEELWAKANTELVRVSPKFGTLLEEETVSASDTSVIFLTPRYLLFRLGNSVSYIDRKQAVPMVGGTVSAFPPAILHGSAVTSIFCDGERITCGGAVSSSVSLRVHRMPQLRARAFRRAAVSDVFAPLRALAYPIE